MSNSNLDQAYIDVFKSFTARVATQTDAPSGFQYRLPGDPNEWRERGSEMYEPVIMAEATPPSTDSDLYVKVASAVADKGKPVVGVLGESFRFNDIPHQVIVKGVVPMKIGKHKTAGQSVEIKPGDLVAPAASDSTSFNDGTLGIHKAASGEYAFGIALTYGKLTNPSSGTSPAPGDTPWVAVLLCRGQVVTP